MFKCECGSELNYNFLEMHKETCVKVQERKRNFQFKQQNNALFKKDNENKSILNEYTIKTSLYQHPIMCLRSFLQTWVCDSCNHSFYDDTPAYYCTLCNFSLCYH